jgi:hypothetical protein
MADVPQEETVHRCLVTLYLSKVTACSFNARTRKLVLSSVAQAANVIATKACSRWLVTIASLTRISAGNY